MVITLTYFPALDSPCISSLNLTLSPSINLFTFQFQLLLHMHIINQRQTPQCPSIKQTLLCSQQDKQHLRGYNMASSSVLTHRRVSKSQQTLPSKILPTFEVFNPWNHKHTFFVYFLPSPIFVHVWELAHFQFQWIQYYTVWTFLSSFSYSTAEGHLQLFQVITY